MVESKNLTRRHVLKLLAGSGVTLLVAPPLIPGRSRFAWAGPGTLSAARLAEISPIDRSLGEIAPRIFFSDYPDLAHKVLWNKDEFVAKSGTPPVPKEKVPLVVVGGGISGLSTAYLLRKHRPILLEQATRFGGNSKGQSWHGIDHSIGAAYFIEPEEDSDIAKFLKEIGLKKWKTKEEEDPVAISGKILKEFWTGESVADDAKEQFTKLSQYFEKVNEGEEIQYPDIPITDPELEGYIKELDRISFKAHLETIAGGPLHPHIETAIEHYCWSSFASTSTEISAASGLNFYASEFSPLAVFPGGNSAVAEQLVSRLARELPESNFRPSSLVYDVNVVADGVVVSYLDAGQAPQAIHAERVVLACPKFVVGKVLRDIEPERLAAVRKLKYRSYLVANVLLKGVYANPFYDLYLLGEGKIDPNDIVGSNRKQKVTDVIMATYAQPSSSSTVLTLYRGMPYDGARAELLDPNSYGRIREEFEKQLNESIFPLLKLRPEQVADMRIARWGHPIVVAGTGLIADGTLDLLRKPFRDRVYFVEQDNWALPAFETAVTEALTWAPVIDAAMAKKSA